jgi:hypothetical protein
LHSALPLSVVFDDLDEAPKLGLERDCRRWVIVVKDQLMFQVIELLD